MMIVLTRFKHIMDCKILATVILLVASSISSQQFVNGQLDEDSSLNETIRGLYEPEHSKCMPMKVEFCRNLPYNQTMLPNRLGHTNDQEVEININVFAALLKTNCSPDLKLFLCSVYAPLCYEIDETNPMVLSPCQSLCESARRGCSSHMEKFNHPWPDSLRCSQFPIYSKENPRCVGKEETSSKTPDESIDELPSSNFDETGIARDLKFACPKNFEVNSYSLHLNGKTYSNCAMPCDNVLLNKNDTQLVRLITGILAIVCLISTLFTCTTFLIDTERFKYPARPIIIISFCQLVVASCYLIGFFTNNKIACNDPMPPPKTFSNMKMIRPMTMGNKKGSCTLQFMALYFFQMSSMCWWLMMTISWYMIARLKWAPEAVSSVARYFHLFSWTVPALLTLYLSVLGNIEGDPLTGTCFVGMFNQESISTFVVYPITACLMAGCLFLASGFKSIHDSRETLRREYGKQTTAEHDKLVTRILVFSLLFIIFAIIILFCNYREQSNLNLWMLAWLSNICENRDYSIPCPIRNLAKHGPHYLPFIMKYVATLAMGIVSALFMLSRKTLIAYKEVAELCNYRF